MSRAMKPGGRWGAVGLCLVASAGVMPGCIIVSSRDSDYATIEAKKADAQYLAARAEIERINLERHKAGLPPIEVPLRETDDPACDDTSPTASP